jgi:hypothetical protein
MFTSPATCSQCGATLPIEAESCSCCGSAVQPARAEFPRKVESPLPAGEIRQIPPEFLNLKRPEVQQPLNISVFSLVLALSFTLIGALFLVLGVSGHLRDSNTYRRLLEEGVVVQGSVQLLRMEEDDNLTTYYVDYQFIAPIKGDPTRIQGSQSVSSDFYRSLREGQTIQVRYAASDPDLSTLEAEFGPPNIIPLLFFGGTGGLGTLVGLAMALYVFRNVHYLRRLRLHGRLTQAFIYDRWEYKDLEGLATYCIAYAFKADLPGRSVVIVSRAEQNKDIYDRYKVGDSVLVRYLPDNPNICRLEIETKGMSP